MIPIIANKFGDMGLVKTFLTYCLFTSCYTRHIYKNIF